MCNHLESLEVVHIPAVLICEPALIELLPLDSLHLENNLNPRQWLAESQTLCLGMLVHKVLYHLA